MPNAKGPKRRRKRDSMEQERNPKHTPDDAELTNALAKTKWGKTYLTNFLDSAERNLRISYVNLKGYFEMFESLGELFKMAVESVGYSDESSFAIAALLGRACGNYFAAVRLSSSGQLAECYAQLRACLEDALYAFNIHSDPTLAKVWFDRHQNDDSRKKSIKQFKPIDILEKLRQKNLSLGLEAAKDYDKCIDFGAHPNERSVTSNLRLSNGKISLELFNTQKGMFEACLLVCVMCGSDAIRIFNLIYPNEFKRINVGQRIQNIQVQFGRIAPGPVYNLRHEAL